MESHVQEIEEFWDHASGDYDRHMEETGHYEAQARLLNLVMKYVESPVIDLAAGTGYIAEVLLKKNIIVTVNDFSGEMIGLCKKKLGSYDNASFCQSNAETINISKKFKTVLCCNLFYYLQDRIKAIESWKNILEKDGKIILFEEYPFQRPGTKVMLPHELALMKIIDPISPQQIKTYFNSLKLLAEFQTAIDQKHHLFGFVYEVAS
ncbi:MAG TPA: class I SAM-dependent methyltransferase [bacterium]|nr:class I SAM-dependent methyltransferase [bacterium]